MLVTSPGKFLSTELALLSSHAEVEKHNRLGTARTETYSQQLALSIVSLTFNGERMLTDQIYFLNSLMCMFIVKVSVTRV